MWWTTPHCMAALCGRLMPTVAYAASTRPEQSYEFGPAWAHAYGLPSWLYANLTTAPPRPGMYGGGGCEELPDWVGLPNALVRKAYSLVSWVSIVWRCAA